MDKQVFKILLVIIVFSHSITYIEGQDDNYLLEVYKEHNNKVNSVAFSKSGKYIASGGEDKLLVIRNTKNEEVFEFSENYFPIKDMEFFGDVQLFVSAGKDIKLVNLRNEQLAIYKGSATHIWSINYAPERNKITAGSYDTKVKIWDAKTEELELVLEGHEKSTLASVFSPDERFLVSGSRDKTIKVWNAKSGKLIHSLEKHSGNIYDIQFHPNPKYFASGSADKTIRLWDIEHGEVVKTYSGHDGAILDIEFSPDGYFMYSAGVDGTVYVWEVSTGKKIYSYVDHLGAVNSIAVNNDNHTIATAGDDRKVMVWRSGMHLAVNLFFNKDLESAREKDILFLPRRKGESRTEYLERQLEAAKKERAIIEQLFLKYEEKVNHRNLPIEQ